MKICVLQPDYSNSSVDYRHYDPPRDLSGLLPQHTVHHVALNKLSTYRQLRQLSRDGYDIFVNLCEGYLDWDVPSIDVIHSLELLNLPYTGPPPHLYDPPKTQMKYVAYTAGVATPAHALVREVRDAAAVATRLAFPLFVKPAHAGDSLGVDEHSLVRNEAQLAAKIAATLPEYDELLVEQYVDGREFTVLVIADANAEDGCHTFRPVEYEFPEQHHFKTYALKTSELHPRANVAVADAELRARLQDAAREVFNAFGGVGYARLDFRMNGNDELFFLEINFTCSVFYPQGSEGSADHILALDGTGAAGFAERIIEEGIARHARRQRPFRMVGNGISGYGIFATRALEVGDVVFRGEERAHRLVTRRHVETDWTPAERRMLRQYGYPISEEVYGLWDLDPNAWAPQNHSCDANTTYEGLDVVVNRSIAAGEELTLDYALLMDETGEEFECRCGAPNCRRTVRGAPGNSVTGRESARRARART